MQPVLMQTKVFAALFSLGFLFGPSQAVGCSFLLRHYSELEVKQMAKDAFAKATTVIDGEVIAPMAVGENAPEGTLPVAAIKVYQIWKGHIEDDIVLVAYVSSCDIGLVTKGQKVRILLSGTGIFTADQETNGWVAFEQTSDFDREIDRLVGATRPADFTRPGELPAPKMHELAH